MGVSKLTAVTTDFGGKLRDARERRGISLRQIAATTKISVSALAALERNDVSRLPGGIFSRALVRSYAVEVGLDPETTVHEFLQRFQETPGLDQPAGDLVAPDGGDVDRQKRLAARVFMLALAGMLLMAAAVGVVVYQMRPSDLANPAAIADGTVPIAPAPVAPATATAPAPAPARAAPALKANELRLELHPTAPCWASVVVGGKRIFSKLIAPGERETVVVADTADLTVGDAGGCMFSINGRPARPLGRSGQVRTARISPRTIDEYFN
jgi:cytoskeleton protein RodZ